MPIGSRLTLNCQDSLGGNRGGAGSTLALNRPRTSFHGNSRRPCRRVATEPNLAPWPCCSRMGDGRDSPFVCCFAECADLYQCWPDSLANVGEFPSKVLKN